MPQFDFATFSEQIFWLLICFFVLYFSVSRIVLPRIAAILKDRDQRIQSDNDSANKLQSQIDEINEVAEALREKSKSSYNEAIEDAVRKSVLDREKAVNKAKKEIEELAIKSEKKITDFITKSKKDYNATAKKVADMLVKKIFGHTSSFKEEVKVSINKFEE